MIMLMQIMFIEDQIVVTQSLARPMVHCVGNYLDFCVECTVAIQKFKRIDGRPITGNGSHGLI